MSIHLKKLLRIPSPKELGLSQYNALPMRDFTPETTDFTWEDYDEYIKNHFPIKYFLGKTLFDFCRNIIWFFSIPIERAYEYIKYNFFKKYHFLDLRQQSSKQIARKRDLLISQENEFANLDYYQYGWADVSSKLPYACFNLLKEYLELEQPYDLLTDYSREEIDQDLGMKAQQDNLEEARKILFWWEITRREQLIAINKLRHEWCDTRSDAKSRATGIDKIKWEQLNLLENQLEQQTTEMLIRLIKIRECLWT